jgi:hypothetical protein
MQRAVGQHRLQYFLGEEGERERHADVVDKERGRLGKSEIAHAVAVGPDNRHSRRKRHDQIVLDDEPKEPSHGFDCLSMTPLSTVLPVREIASKKRFRAAISTSMKLRS